MTAATRFVLVGLMLGAPVSAMAQDALEPVRALYAAADYEGALGTLARLEEERKGAPVLDLERYRVFCLIALGRATDADQVIERIVAIAPLYEPGADEAPRIRTAFRTVRRRVLPVMARTLYADGKASYDRRAYLEAVQTFERALPIIEHLSSEGRPGMDDMRILVEGFLELSRDLVPPPPPVAPEPLPARATVIAIAVPPADAPTLDVTTEPVVIAQDLPPWTHLPPGSEVSYSGSIVVDIDEHGDVVDASIVESIYPLYNQDLLRASRGWKYEPARRNGRPVSSQKRVEVVLRPR